MSPEEQNHPSLVESTDLEGVRHRFTPPVWIEYLRDLNTQKFLPPWNVVYSPVHVKNLEKSESSAGPPYRLHINNMFLDKIKNNLLAGRGSQRVIP